MSKFPSITSKRLIAFLEKQGFVIDHTSGSHVVLFHSKDRKRVVVPFHRRDVPKGTLLAILKEAGFSKEDYLNKR